MKTSTQFWDERPCNIRHSSLPMYAPDYFREVRLRKFEIEPHLVRFMEAPLWDNKLVLDIGCGIGSTAVRFAQWGAYVTAVDLSPKSCEMTAQHVRCMGLDNITVRNDNAEILSTLVHQPYDLIFAWGSLHHMEHPERALKTWRQFAMPETQLKVMVYHRYSYRALQLWLRYGSKWTEHTEAQQGCPISRAYTPSEAVEIVHAAGWRVTKVEVAFIFPWRVKDYIKHRYVKAFPWNVAPQRAFKWLEKRIGWHLLLDGEAM